MLALPDVTLCCVDTRESCARIARARPLAGSNLLRAHALRHRQAARHRGAAQAIEIAVIPPLASRDAYSDFVLKSLLPHVATSHVLLVQWDGYVINPAAWDPAFLECDYIGAKWFWHEDGMRVGNGGFSLRSRRLLEALQDPAIVRIDAEDTTIGRSFRPLLEREYGIRFGSEALADRFSFEASTPSASRLDSTGSTTSAAPCRRTRSPRFARRFPTPSRARRSSSSCCATAVRSTVAGGHRDRASNRRGGTGGRRAASIARCGAAARPGNAGSRPQRSLPLRQRQEVQAVPWLAFHARGKRGARSGGRRCAARAAFAAHRSGNIDEAERGYRAALAIAPENPLVSHYLGVVLYQRNRLDEAIPLLERSAAARPQEPEFHNNLGLALRRRTAMTMRSPRFAARSTSKPGHATAWNNLGLVLNAALRLPEAVAAFREAIAHKPDFAQAHWNLSLASVDARRLPGRLARVCMARIDRRARRARAHSTPARAGTGSHARG